METQDKSIKPKVIKEPAVLSLAEKNREKIKPYVEKIQEQIYVYLDRAASNGFEFKEDMPKDKADQLLTVILADIMEHYQGSEVVQDRNMFETIAFTVGAIIGYKAELVSICLRKLPLAQHFYAGGKWGGAKAQNHVNIALAKFSSNKEKLATKTAEIMDTVKNTNTTSAETATV